ncbi:MAG: PIN domain-containing protein [Spirochaetaceae bacterium]|nr:MAG: PIN domain-containing protein [Spirochaetaceae bacterium]
MILHLDTHVVVWLYSGTRKRFPQRAAAALDHARLVYTPIVGLELTYLHEVGRVSVAAAEILGYLRDRISLVPDETPYLTVAREAEQITWTRDPFDRLITAAASVTAAPLLTSDGLIRERYPAAVWE